MKRRNLTPPPARSETEIRKDLRQQLIEMLANANKRLKGPSPTEQK